MKEKIKQSVILKSISYILIPILIALLIICIAYTIYVSDEENEVWEKSSYIETGNFGRIYQNKVQTIINRIKYLYDNNLIWQETGNIIYSPDYTDKIVKDDTTIFYHGSWDSSLKFLLVNKNTAYTNYDLSKNTSDIEKIKGQIINHMKQYWCFNQETKQVNTNIRNDLLTDIEYTDFYSNIENSGYDIYTYLESEGDSIQFYKFAFETAKKLGWTPTILIPVFVAITIILIVYLLISIGHKKQKEGIYLSTIDKCPIEIIIFSIIFILWLAMCIIQEASYGDFPSLYYLIVSLSIYIVLYIIMAIATTIVIKKIKTKTLIKSSIIYKISKKIFNIFKFVISNIDLNIKVIASFIGFVLISMMLANLPDMGIIFLMFFWFFVLYYILVKVNQFRHVKKVTKHIYEGNVEEKIDESLVKGELKDLSIYINDIAGGFSNAIEQSLKSERLKTELITNVSHDIKTPLTSIINYVDLLKQEKIENEKVNEYIKVLDNKSQRLKKLTEDLIEASKASSGNIKLTIETINLQELIKQSIGEFEDKFKEKNLEIIMALPKENINIKADSKYMYRIVENLYSNIYKYSAENSRVYIDVRTTDGEVTITLKNISKDRLNISVDELMERFIRGDKSRNTEGSGLGLSITRSLVDLQNGKFNIQVDGDLFKVELVFPKSK